MGFLEAVRDLGALDEKQGLEPYLQFPLEKGGKVIRVFLDIPDLSASTLTVQGIGRIDITDQKTAPDMLLKYLYRKEVGANVSWRFNPMHKIGRPKSSEEGKKEDWLGKSGNWQQDKDAHLFKIRSRILAEYERTEVLTSGSVDLIMAELEKRLPEIWSMLAPKASHVLLFGGFKGDQFVYPGEIPAFVAYFEKKLQASLGKGQEDRKTVCALCRQEAASTTLNKVFKFATLDKIHVLPGLDSKAEATVFPVCRRCLEQVSAGRERVERALTNAFVVPGIRMWVIPEAIGTGNNSAVREVVERLEELKLETKLEALGEKREDRMFTRLAKQGKGLVFHFVFWEKNNAQEMVHLMVEDVPPERLSRLEAQWQETLVSMVGEVDKGLDLDWAIRSLYVTLSRFAGKSEADKQVFRDFSLKIIGKMLQGEALPIAAFKAIVVSRVLRLVYESESWDDVRRGLRYAQVWTEFMYRVEKGV